MMSNFRDTILVTGGTSGLGYAAALEIAKQSPQSRVVIASRSDRDHAADSMNKRLGQNNVTFMPLDLISTTKVRLFVEQWSNSKYPPISALVMNAGLQFPSPVVYSDDGIEKTFAVNHIGHALLCFLLRPYLASTCRIILTASGTHDPAQKTGIPDAIYNTAEELAHPTAESEKYDGRQRYATSKLCNVLWTYALDNRLSKANKNGKHWTVNAFDPGLMPGTGLAREANAVLRFIWNKLLPRMIPFLKVVLRSNNIHTAAESGSALARLALADDVNDVSGKYYEGLRQIDSSVDSKATSKQEDLWSWTIEHVSKNKEEARTFNDF